MENLHKKAIDHEDQPVRDWVQPLYTPPEADLKEETGTPEGGIDYGVLVLPPLQGQEPMWPEDYVKYCRQHMKEYSRELGKPPEWKWEQEG